MYFPQVNFSTSPIAHTATAEKNPAFNLRCLVPPRWPSRLIPMVDDEPDPLASGRCVTVLHDVHGRPQGKVFTIGAAGSVEKHTADHAGDYHAQTVFVAGLPALAELIAGLSADSVLILGCIPDAGFDPYRIEPQGTLRRRLGLPRDVRPSGVHTIGDVRYAARLKENFISSRYLLIDRDPDGAPPEVASLSESGYIGLIDRAWPGIAAAERIVFASSSGRVTYPDGRAALTLGASSHTYVEMAGDAWRDWDDLRVRMEAAGSAAGLGYTVTGKAGASLKRWPWDTSVFTAGREVFESAPAVGLGLLLLPRSWNHTPGEICPPPPALCAASVAALEKDTGAKVRNGRSVAVDTTGALTLSTVVETQRYGILTVAEYVARQGERSRCQTPFRQSGSWNGIIGRTAHGGVYVHDNGLRRSYFCDAPDAESAADQESPTDAAALKEDSDFAGDLKILSATHTAQCRATARKIIGRYSWQSPRRRTFAELAGAVIAALPAGHNPGIPRSLEALAGWHDRQARQRAVASSALDDAALRNAGISRIEVADLAGLAVRIAADPGALWLIKAPQGAGKTQDVLKPLAGLAGCSIAITNRVSLVADLCARLNLSSYQTVRPGDIEATQNLGICLPSLVNPKFADVLSRADNVLIDEVGAVLREIHTVGGTVGKTGPDTLCRLVAMLNQARVAVGVDADLSTLDVLTLAGLVNRRVCVIEMTAHVKGLSVRFADADEMKAEILSAVTSGQKIRVACDSSRTALELAALIRERNPDLNVMCIQSRGGDSTAGDPAVLEFLKDVNSGVAGLDVLIHSPTLESGVSITTPHFDRTFGIFSGRSVAPAAFIQMLRRDRTATLIEIGLAGNGKQWLPTSTVLILDALESTHRRSVELANESGSTVAGVVNIEAATPFDSRICDYTAARNGDANDAIQNLLLLLQSRGFDVQPAHCAFVMSKEEKAEARLLADTDYQNRVLAAPAIDDETRADIAATYQPSPAQCAMAERYDAAQAVGVAPDELSSDDLRLFEHGALPRWNRRWDLATTAPLSGLEADVSDAKFTPTLALRRHELALAEAYRTFWESAGLDWRTGAGEVTADSAMETWRNLKASPCRAVLEHDGLCRFDRVPKYPVRWVGDALRKFGLALEEHGHGEDRRYTIQRDVLTTKDGLTVKAPGWDAMTRCSQMRDKRRKDYRVPSVSFDLDAMIRNAQPRQGAPA